MFFGSAYWRFMHHFALYDIGRELMDDLGTFINCTECASEYQPPQENEDLINWSKDLHNKVNKKLGKWDRWDLTDFNIAHKKDCDICANKEIFGYPWIFIHNVASTGENSIDFLKKFNELYPCDVHKGKLLEDQINENESVLDWTIRNHQKFYPSFQYNINGNSSEDCIGCTTNQVNL